MKIGFFTDSYLPSPDGVATSVESSAKALHALGHEVYIIAPNQPHTKDRKDVIRILSVHIMTTPDVWWGLEIPQPSLFKIAKLELDIIHGHSGGPISVLGWQLAYLHTIPFVETYHTSWEHYQHYFPLPRIFDVKMIKKLNKFFNNDCDAIIAPSVKAKNELLREGIVKPIYVIPNGIHRAKFQNQKKGYLYTLLKIPREKKIILTVGRLNKEKSIDFLLRVFTRVQQTHEDIVFVIVGQGRMLEKLQSLAQTLNIANKVYFTGSISYTQMPEIYADAHLFIFASKTETQGLVVIEAMASSVPVVVVDDVVFEEVITDGQNGFRVAKEEALFADKIKNILHDTVLHTKLARNAKESTNKFSVQFTSKILEQIYEEIIFQKNITQNANKVKKLPEEIENLITNEFATLKELITQLRK